MNLEGHTLFAGHDGSNKKMYSGYYNNCEVKYVKYFNNAICTME